MSTLKTHGAASPDRANAQYTLSLVGEFYEVRFKIGARQVKLSLEGHSRRRGGLSRGDAEKIAQELANRGAAAGAVEDMNGMNISLQIENGPKSESEYGEYARMAVARAGAQHHVDPKLAHVFFDANTNERIDSVDVGAPRPMPVELKVAFEVVRDTVAGFADELRIKRGMAFNDEYEKPESTALAALDEIETALSGQLVASFKWEPAQDPPIPGHVAHPDDAQESPLVRLPFVCPDDVEDENFITQGGGWATFKRNHVWWVERASDKCRVSFSLHTADDAVAGARFYEFREKHRATALQFLLLTTVSERSAWVKK